MNEFYVEKLSQLVTISHNLIHHCQQNKQILGISKLEQKIKSEQKFLIKLEKHSHIVKKFYLSSSNLIHLNGIVKSFLNLPNVISVMQPFSCPTLNFKLIVDIVCNNGAAWVKVVARNSKALIAESLGQKDFGEKTLVDQAIELYEFSKFNLHYFKKPFIIFIFLHSIPKRLAKRLKSCNINVCHFSEIFKEYLEDINGTGNYAKNFEKENNPLENIELNFYSKKHNDNYFKDLVNSNNFNLNTDDTKEVYITRAIDFNDYSESNLEPISLNISPFEETKPLLFDIEYCSKNCICNFYMHSNADTSDYDLYAGLSLANLDITALMALVSNLSHGSTNHDLKTEVLRCQAAEEKTQHVLSHLLPFLKSRKLVVCQSALNDFEKILDFVGGPNEKKRASQLSKCLYIVNDKEFKDDLKETSRMSKRAWTIFTTGHQLQAVTVTANKGFIRAASQMKVKFVVFIHDARALTESKENTEV